MIGSDALSLQVPNHRQVDSLSRFSLMFSQRETLTSRFPCSKSIISPGETTSNLIAMKSGTTA